MQVENKALRNQGNAAFSCCDVNDFYKSGIIWWLLQIILENITGKKTNWKLQMHNLGLRLKIRSPCSSFKRDTYLNPQNRYGQRSSTKPEYKGLRIATIDKWVTLTYLLFQGNDTVGEEAEPWDMGWRHWEDKITENFEFPNLPATHRSKSGPPGRPHFPAITRCN